MSQQPANLRMNDAVTAPAPAFLDVTWLLEASQPRARVAWVGPGVGLFLLVVLGSALLSSRSSELKAFR
jgi:hypothetical protein